MNRDELPVIATDIDGVVVKWQSGLPYFAQKYNLPLQHILDLIIDDKFVSAEILFDCHRDLAYKLMEKYNSSDFIRYLAPYNDALDVINKMKSKYRFVAVTALGNDVDSMLNRKFNLNALFPGAFDDIFVCGHNESKSGLLKKVNEQYGDKVVAFVDDMPHHVEAAYEELSCPVFFMPRGHRDEEPSCPHKKVRDWKDLEWAINMSMPVVSKETKEKDTMSIQEIIDKLNKMPGQYPGIAPTSPVPFIEKWVKPMTPCDPVPQWPEWGTDTLFDWRSMPKITSAMNPEYALLNLKVANDEVFK